MGLFSTPAKTVQFNRFTPQQMGVMGAANRGALEALKGLSGPMPQFGPIAQRAQTQFQQQTVPSIMERLTQMGGLHSSALAGSIGEAGAHLNESLAAQEQQFNQQNRAQQMQLLSLLLQSGLQPQFETMYQPEQLNFLGQLVGGGLQALPSLAGLALGGPVGGAIGSGLGGLMGSLFSGGERSAPSPAMSAVSSLGQALSPRYSLPLGASNMPLAGLAAGATA